MAGICSAHMGDTPEPGCDLCTRNPGNKCDACGETLKIGDEIHFADDMCRLWHVRCLPVLTPELLQQWAQE